MIRTIVFDFGNVVGYFSHRRATECLSAHAGVPADVLHGRLFGGALEDDYESGRVTTAEFLRRIRDLGRFTCDDTVLAAGYAEIFWPNPDICALVAALKPGYTLLLGSNTNDL